MGDKVIKGFSKLSKTEKIKWLAVNFFKDPEMVIKELVSYWHTNEEHQKVLDGISENTISNFVLPYGVAPNFVIDGEVYAVPMVIEESSVVAAASSAAKFWADRGGFHTEILGTVKVGQVHFIFDGPDAVILAHKDVLLDRLIEESHHLVDRMQQRGGGITHIDLINRSKDVNGLFQVKAEFETCDSMGANFINSVLEQFAQSMQRYFEETDVDALKAGRPEIIMSILSNYTPECVVRTWVECPVEKLGNHDQRMKAEEFAQRFMTAVKIAKADPFRAVTHNKGIFNGIDAVVLATGNDFRAIEACGHAYASRNGRYEGLSDCSIKDGLFRFEMDIPLALGTVGGLTGLHPMAKRSLEMLHQPSAPRLMSVIASVGLAQNFAAIRSLVTTGIQKGHMKMHLQNILSSLKANDSEKGKALAYFEDRTVSYSGVRAFLDDLRKG